MLCFLHCALIFLCPCSPKFATRAGCLGTNHVVSVLIDRGARLEIKSGHGDTPLVRAIQANSREIIQLLLERGARVNKLPTPPGVASLKGPTEPI